ncbi:MAG: YceI family protein [Cytophagaceae bacterium]|jgi:polyisoprenoid-binding protein YceI|nr:YceI family protein [Cytophagaceae bacterium]
MATTWTLDPTHSEVQFKVKHLMVSNVTGSFGDFSASAESNDDTFENAGVSFSAKIDSISTGNEQRDGHLKSGDFFDAEKFPTISFNSTSFDKKGDDYILKGNLTIKDVTKPVELAVEFNGIGKDPWGNIKAGFSVNGKINRNDFGLTWNAALETGGVLVSEEVKLLAEIQLVKQA